MHSKITTRLGYVSSETTAVADKSAEFGTKHWLFQVIPPVLLLILVLSIVKANSLVFLVGAMALPFLFSLVSVLVRLIRFRRGKYYLARPVLTIGVFLLLFLVANWTYDIALEQAVSEGRSIQQQCNQDSVCPDTPEGWSREGSTVMKNDLGFWLKYSAWFFREKDNAFVVRLYRAPDLGHDIRGGVDLPFTVELRPDR